MSQLSPEIISQLVTFAGNNNLEVVAASDGCVIRNRAVPVVVQPASVQPMVTPVQPAPPQYQQQQFPVQYPQIPPYMWPYMMQAMTTVPHYNMDMVGPMIQAAYHQMTRQQVETQPVPASNNSVQATEPPVETIPEVQQEAPAEEAQSRTKAVQKPKAETISTPSKPAPKQETKSSKGDWLKVAIAASNKQTPPRSPAAAVVGVDIESQAIPEGYVTGDHLTTAASKNGGRRTRPVCYTVNCRGNCTNYLGIDIPHTTETNNLAVHGNAAGSRPTTANFCNNGGVTGGRVCENPKCTNNHVLIFMTPEQLSETRRLNREQGQKNRGRSHHSNAINDSGDRPAQTQIADFVRVEDADASEGEVGTPRVLSVSIGGLNLSTEGATK